MQSTIPFTASRFTVSSLLGSYALQYGMASLVFLLYFALQYDKAWPLFSECYPAVEITAVKYN